MKRNRMHYWWIKVFVLLLVVNPFLKTELMAEARLEMRKCIPPVEKKKQKKRVKKRKLKPKYFKKAKNTKHHSDLNWGWAITSFALVIAVVVATFLFGFGLISGLTALLMIVLSSIAAILIFVMEGLHLEYYDMAPIWIAQAVLFLTLISGGITFFIMGLAIGAPWMWGLGLAMLGVILLCILVMLLVLAVWG